MPRNATVLVWGAGFGIQGRVWVSGDHEVVQVPRGGHDHLVTTVSDSWAKKRRIPHEFSQEPESKKRQFGRASSACEHNVVTPPSGPNVNRVMQADFLLQDRTSPCGFSSSSKGAAVFAGHSGGAPPLGVSRS